MQKIYTGILLSLLSCSQVWSKPLSLYTDYDIRKAKISDPNEIQKEDRRNYALQQ